jgi:HlyD family secretion protein
MRRMASIGRAGLPWLVLLAVIAAGAVGYRVYQQRTADTARAAALAALRTETVALGDITARVSATGSILPERQTSLFFLSPGTVAEVLVESGQVVEAGQVLARLDATQQRLAVQQAADALSVAELNRDKLLSGPDEDDVAVAQANLRSANAVAGDVQAGAGAEEVAIAQIRYDSAQTDYRQLNEQYNGLVQLAQDHPRFAPPQDVLDRLKASMEQAYYAAEVARLELEQTQQGGSRGQVSVAYAQILHAQAVLSQTLAPPSALELQQAQLAVDQAAAQLARAELELARTELLAPYGGIIAAVEARRGEPAVPARPAMTLLDDTRFHLDVSVDEVDVAQLALDQPVSVLVEALPGVSLSGRVDRLSPTATVTEGLVTYTVRLVLDPTEAPLRAGMSATADIEVAEVQAVVVVPNWAIRRDRRTGQAFASLQQGGALVEVPITTGLRGETYTEVLTGVQPGDVAAISTERDGLDLDLLGGN